MSRQTVSIRAPAWGAMATHSKIRPFRAPSHPLIAQNRRNLGNPFPHRHPYVRPLREKMSRFYDHLRFALELSFGISHSFVLRLQNFGRPRQTTFFWSNPSPNQATVRPHQTIKYLTKPFLWPIHKTSFPKSVTHIKNYCSEKRKTLVNKQVFSF